MLKKTVALLILSAAFSAPTWADWDHDRSFGRVIRVEPAVSIGFRDGRNQFQILYEFGGAHYWTYADYYPGPWIAVPAPRYVYPYRWDNRYYAPYRWDQDRRHHDGWSGGRWRGGDHDGGHRGR